MRQPVSNRERKRVVKAGVRALKSKPGWDPARFAPEDTAERLDAAQQVTRSERIYDRAVACDACAREREDTGDTTALCDEHLAAAMGL